jgi:hypothetical protein
VKDLTKPTRRQLLKMGGLALVAIPVVGFSGSAFATQNTAVRTALKFQNKPNGDKECNGCVNFIPNKDKPADAGAIHGCKLYPGDTEIPPNGYCMGFVAKPKK